MDQKICVTGGAGFIGSETAKKLLKKGYEVKIIDNLSSGKKENLPKSAEFIQTDIKKESNLEKILKDVETVFHFAANPKVSTFPENRDKDFKENLKGTKNLLEACEKQNVEEIIFASSSVVYGEEAEIPTPETSKINPISMYGATKAGAEHMCKVYKQIFDIDLTILRYANIVSEKNPKGVTYDFVNKLKENPEDLTILGNGKQRKSYLYLEDAIEATIKAWKSDQTTFNIGSEDSIDVDKIAEIVTEEMNLDPDIHYTGGEKGWEGDVPEMRLDITKIKNENWKPKHNSEESIRRTTQELYGKIN